MQTSIMAFANQYKIVLLVVLLTIVAALPRFYGLGDLGFYMDEETTAFASRSLAETGSPQMPSGMPYYRSLPHTWLNSISANIFGLDKEFSYRLPGAVLGTLTIPLLFLLARPFTGTAIAFLAALLLGLSEWHIITSRQARMYAPFLFFYMAGSFSILYWAKKDSIKNLLAASLLFLTAASFHKVGVFLALIPLIVLFIKDYTTTPQYKLILFSIILGLITYFAGETFVSSPYQQWKEVYGIGTAQVSNHLSVFQNLSLSGLQVAQGFISLLLGIWLAKSAAFTDTSNGKEIRLLSRYLLAILLTISAGTGHLHGAFLAALLLLMLYPHPLPQLLKATMKPLLAIVILATVTLILIIMDNGVVGGIKSLLMFPYPNWITLFTLSAGLTLLFIPTMIFLASKDKSASNIELRVLLIISLFPLILIGIFMKWAAARYLIQAYPFMLILVSYALFSTTTYIIKNKSRHARSIALTFSGLLILSGALGGHGLPSAYKVATADYGDYLNEAALIFPFYPDHKTPGEFVAAHRSTEDIVIAEDVLEQRWYAGKIDYWLRQYSDDNGGLFMYQGEDNQFRDIYVNSTLATLDILRALTTDNNKKVWLITSGETFHQRPLYLRPDQLKWLENIEATHTPIFTGRDNNTRVYCLNCTSTL